MVKYNLQFFGGRGSAGGNKATSNDDVLSRFRDLNRQYEDLDNMSSEEIEKMGEEKWEAKREQLGARIDAMADEHPELEKEYMERVAEPYRAEKKAEVASKVSKPKVDKAKAFEEKTTKLKSEMKSSQFSKKWTSMLKNAPIGSRIVLEGRNWENSKSQDIWVYKTSAKTVKVQFGNGSPSTRNISEFPVGGMLNNYYVGKVQIDVEDKNEHWGYRTLKKISLKRG